MLDLTVHTVAWNEAFLLPYFIRHYSKFAKHIVIHDNDSTEPIPRHPKVSVEKFSTGDRKDEKVITDVKNECWKHDTTRWILICDVDEFIIPDFHLFDTDEPVAFRCEGWNMVGWDGQYLPDIDHAARPFGRAEGAFDKLAVFHRDIGDINYRVGCHEASPTARIIPGHVLRHYNMLGLKYITSRWQRFAGRLSDHSQRMGYSSHYRMSEQSIAKRYEAHRRRSCRVPSLRTIYSQSPWSTLER